MGSSSSSGGVSFFPLFYRLLENGEQKAVILVPDSTALKEINTMQQLARESGTIITLEKTTRKEWLQTHA